MVRAIYRSGWRTTLPRGKPIRAHDRRAGLARGDCSENERLYGYQPDADSDITVTAGATEALYAAITALVRNGDEVICFDPSYDSYSPAIALSGGIVKRMALQPPHFRVDWQEFAALLSERTRLVTDTPHNPSATIWAAG